MAQIKCPKCGYAESDGRPHDRTVYRELCVKCDPPARPELVSGGSLTLAGAEHLLGERPPLGGSEPAPAPTRAELERERERGLLAEAILYAEAATTERATSPTTAAMIAAGWRFGLGNVGAETSLGRAADNLHDAGLLVVDWRLGAFRVAPGQLERCRAELEARS